MARIWSRKTAPSASGKRPRKVGLKVETKSQHPSVHIVVEHAAGLDMLIRGSDGGEWGPCWNRGDHQSHQLGRRG